MVTTTSEIGTLVPVAHARVELFGTMCSGAERWSAGFSTAPPDLGLTNLATMAADALADFNNLYWTAVAIQGKTPATVALVGCKVSSYGSDGKLISSGQSVLGTAVAGTGGTALPPQCAIVASLRTPLMTARGRGRMYLPMADTTCLTTTGRLTTAQRDAVALRMQSFLNAFNARAADPSAVVSSAAGSFNSSVTLVQVGDVVDTQRRRRDALPEAYASQTITP